MPRRSGLPLLLLVLVTACGAGWQRLDDPTPRPLPARAQVQVWQEDRVTVLHGVIIQNDTLTGVPFTQPPACDRCRVEFWLRVVDSLRVGSKEGSFFRSAGLVVVLMSAFVYLFQGIGGN